MDQLDILVDYYVEGSVESGHSSEGKDLLKRALVQEVLKSTKERLSDEAVAEMKARLEREEEEKRRQLGLRRAAQLISEALFIALLVGLVVNQATNILEIIRQRLNWGSISFPLVVIFLSVVIIIFAVIKEIGFRTGKEDNSNGG